jgi:hypothetical protein
MGGTSSSKTSQTSQLAPYDPASGSLNGILGGLNNLVPQAGTLSSGQQGAINQVVANSNSQPNYNPAIASGTTGLLNGGGAQSNDAAIKSNLGMLQNGVVGQTASGANIGNNMALKAQLDTAAADTSQGINSQWAAAGRDGSPGNAQAVARGVAQAQAPIIAAQYNTDVSNALNAGNTLYNAGNSTYGLLNGNQAAANTNFTNGIGAVSSGLNAENAAPTATINALAQQFNIPASQLSTLLGTISPVAAQFGTQNGTSDTTSQMSGAQQFATILSGIGSIMPKGPISFGG